MASILRDHVPELRMVTDSSVPPDPSRHCFLVCTSLAPRVKVSCPLNTSACLCPEVPLPRSMALYPNHYPKMSWSAFESELELEPLNLGHGPPALCASSEKHHDLDMTASGTLPVFLGTGHNAGLSGWPSQVGSRMAHSESLVVFSCYFFSIAKERIKLVGFLLLLPFQN